MKKTILFLIILTIYSTTIFAYWTDNRYIYYDCEGTSTSTLNDVEGNRNGTLYGSPARAGGSLGNRSLVLDGSNDFIRIQDTSNFNQWSMCFSMNASIVDNEDTIYAESNDGLSQDAILKTGVSHNMKVTYNYQTITDNKVTNGSWETYCITHDGSLAIMYLNGTAELNKSDTDNLLSLTYNYFGGRRWDVSPNYENLLNANVDEIMIWNRTLSGDEIYEYHMYALGILENNIPVISNINCTSCNIPDGDITPPYETSDTTPTFSLSTDVSANCRIGDENLNYTSMGSSRNCSGLGTKEHTCTLTTQDELKYSTDYAYISCANVNNESLTNTTELLMDITDLVTNSTQAIRYGLENSVIWPGATVYSDQQVYLRDLNNNQILETVDKIAVYGNQRWIFNYAGENETPLGNLFNITPVVYSWEGYNLSFTEIEDQIGLFINSTKN